MSTLLTIPLLSISSYWHGFAGGFLFPLCCVSWLAGSNYISHLDVVRQKVGSTLGSLDEQIWTGLVQSRGQEVGRETWFPSPPFTTYFYTVCASAPKVKIDLIYLPVGKPETHSKRPARHAGVRSGSARIESRPPVSSEHCCQKASCQK